MTTATAIIITKCVINRDEIGLSNEEKEALKMAIIALKSKSFRCEYCKFGTYTGSDIWICFKKDGDQVARNGICENYQFDTAYYD